MYLPASKIYILKMISVQANAACQVFTDNAIKEQCSSRKYLMGLEHIPWVGIANQAQTWAKASFTNKCPWTQRVHCEFRASKRTCVAMIFPLIVLNVIYIWCTSPKLWVLLSFRRWAHFTCPWSPHTVLDIETREARPMKDLEVREIFVKQVPI